MSGQRPEPSATDWAAALLAVDPTGLGGIRLRARFGPAREAWLKRLRLLLPSDAAWRKLPLSVDETRLLGGLDLGATLQAGRPVTGRGLLAEADGGIVVIAMAERLPVATAAHVAAVLDAGESLVERDGLSLRAPARIGVVALDEGVAEEEEPPQILLDRLAFHVALPDSAADAGAPPAFTRDQVLRARAALPRLDPGDTLLESLAAASLALGIDSLRALHFAVRAACAAAALEGAEHVAEHHAALAMQLVFVSRATRLPESPDAVPDADAGPDSPAEAQPPEPQKDDGEQVTDELQKRDQVPETMTVETAAAALPEGLLRLVQARGKLGRRPGRAGRAGTVTLGGGRGRPAGVLGGKPGKAARFNLVATLRAAAPWQTLRRSASGDPAGPPKLEIRSEDWRVTRLKRRSETTTIFVVDASGSSALHRLGEAKGAVALMLAECYIRRDRVAVIAFRGTGAEVVLPPTRSLARAKRCLAGVPGGGGTPLATAIDAATDLAAAMRGKGQTPAVVLLTDGRGNVTRDGRGNRAQAETDALAAARRHRAAEVVTIVIDTAPRAGEAAQRLAQEAGARYLPLPSADAAAISRSIRAEAAASRRAGT